MSWKAKKLVAFLVISTLVTGKKEEKFDRVPYIWYLITFKDQTEALLDSESEVNVMNQVFAHQLALKIWKTNIEAQKIDGTILETYGMVVLSFFMADKDDRKRFFKKSFLLADVKPDIMLGMLFLTISNTNTDFQARDLQ